MDTTDSQSDKQIIEAELYIEKIISNGCGLAFYSGRAVFIPFTVPGETILAEIDLSGKKFLEGKVLDIISPSPDRVDPVCPLYKSCGGCNLQHISNEKQLEIRRELVSEALRRNGGIKDILPEIISGKPFGYRCRIQLHPSAGGVPGFKKRKGNTVIPVKNCPVCNEGINRYLSEPGTELTDRTILFAPDDSFAYSSSDKDVELTVPINNKPVKTLSSSFFQSNIDMYERAALIIKEYSKGEVLLDLYAGSAVFGTLLSDNFSRIISVEENSSALRCGEQNIPSRKGLTKIFYPVSVEKFIKRDRSRTKPDTIIVDPPRTGLSKQVRTYLKMIKPEILIYLSCDYATMARDLGELTEKSYNIDMVKIFDFYPQTSHAETLAVLSAKS